MLCCFLISPVIQALGWADFGLPQSFVFSAAIWSPLQGAPRKTGDPTLEPELRRVLVAQILSSRSHTQKSQSMLPLLHPEAYRRSPCTPAIVSHLIPSRPISSRARSTWHPHKSLTVSWLPTLLGLELLGASPPSWQKPI